MKYERFKTWELTFTDGTLTHIYCKKSDLLDNITARQFVNLVSAKIVNRGNDKTNHKAIKKEQLI